MNKTVYKQYDDRWGNLPYPGSGSYLSDSGCGCLAVFHAAIERSAYKNLTVPQCRNYMVQYATVQNGTLWSGITEGLKHYGYTVHWREADSMSDIFAQLKSSLKSGVILFAKPSGYSYGPDGTLWTKSGHYIYFGDYKIEKDGTHWFYLKDSGSRNHDGWYCFEKSMKGCCRNVWICKSAKDSPAPSPTPDPTPTPRPNKYNGNYPVVKKYLEPGDRGENVIRLQQYLDWYYNGAFFKECGGADGIYGGNTLRWVKKMQAEFFGAKEADGLVGPKTIAEMKKRGGYVEPTPAPKNYTDVIDVSAAQSAIDWNKVKAAGIDGVMVKCGYRGYEKGVLKEDSMFMKHIKGAASAGLKLGIYFYTQAINYNEGKEEADYAISLLNKAGVTLYYPIAIDSENCPPEKAGDKPRANNISKSARTQAIKGFCDQIKARGYRPMLYANLNDLSNKIDVSKLDCDIWCAQYYTECQYKGKYVMWQYTSTGKVAGVSGNVDRDKCYITAAAPKPVVTPAQPISTPPIKASYTGAYPTESEMYSAQMNGMAQACKDQTSWSYDSVYKWESNPTVAKSKIKSTCVTYVACVLQRIGILPSGKYIWHDGKGYGTGKVTHATNLMTVTYYNNKKTLKDIALKTCDIVLYDDNKSGKSGEGGHIEIFNGSKNATNSFFYTGGMGSHKNTSNNRKEPNTRKVLAVVRIKYRGYIRKGDRGIAVIKLQNYLNWYFNGAFFKECGGADGIFGENTHKWVVKMQTEMFGAEAADGTVGPKTIAKMKTIVR